MKKTALIAGLAVMLLTLGTVGPAHAQGRWVVVNGNLQSPMSLAILDRYACGVIPNGNYWLNYTTGVWGYADDPRPMGYISAGCRQSGGGSGQPSLSERGMLYSSSPWGRGR